MRTLILATPEKRGADVHTAQTRLSGSNVFRTNFKPGPVDSVFGETTARAAKRAKYWLGYSPDRILPMYGLMIDQFLSGKTKLPPAYAARRNARIEESKLKPLREKALARAVTQIGVKESPTGSNNVLYGRWYGANEQAWCAMFCTWCYVLEGSKIAFVRGNRYAYVPYIVNNARAGVYHAAVTHTPLPGDLVCFDWQSDGVADHVGIFEKWLANGMFQTVEGNTSINNNSNGGQVMRRERYSSTVKAFVHVAE